MKLYQFNSKEELFLKLGIELAHFLEKNHQLKIGLATGQTMIPFYESLKQSFHGRTSLFKNHFYFNLDEYCDLGKLHPSSFFAYMNHYFYLPFDIPRSHCFIPDGNAIDKEKEAKFYEDQVGNLHLCFLGLGINGHIGFNEPFTSFSSLTRLVELSDETKIANQSQFVGEQTPSHAISMGIKTILRSKKIILVVTQDKKAHVLSQCLLKKDEKYPASSLISHPDVSILAVSSVFSLLSQELKQTIVSGENFLF